MVGVCFLVLVLAMCLESIFYTQAVGRANTRADTLARKLADAESRVERCTEELGECRSTVRGCQHRINSIAERLDTDATSLQSVIKNLKYIREEVAKMEDYIVCFYSDFGESDDLHYLEEGVTE